MNKTGRWSLYKDQFNHRRVLKRQYIAWHRRPPKKGVVFERFIEGRKLKKELREILGERDYYRFMRVCERIDLGYASYAR